MNRLPYTACKPIYDALGIEFTEAQLPVVQQEERFPLITGGERGGKSVVSVCVLLPHVVMLPVIRRDRFYDPAGKLRFDVTKSRPRNAHFLIFGPTYVEPRIEFQYLENYLTELGMLAGGINKPSKPQEGPWRMVTTSGVVIATWSTENPASIRAQDLEGAIFAEAGNADYEAVLRVHGRISAKRGFIVLNGTLERAQQWYQDWMITGQRPNKLLIKSYSLPTWTNLHEFPGGRNDPEILRMEDLYGPDLFAMRVMAEARPLKERVLNEFSAADIHDAKIPKDAVREIWVDPGYASAYAVLFVAMWQEEKGMKFYVYDELYEQGLTNDLMIQLCQRRTDWKLITAGVIDIASQGHRDANESSIEIWKKRSRLPWNMKYWSELSLMERIRSSASQRAVIISPRCRGLIAEAGLGEPVFQGMHPWRYATDRSGRIIGEKPIDRWNHCHDAKTDILTERGWVPFPELRNEDAVAVWGEDMGFEVPESVTRDEYDGPLLVHEGGQLDFAVTPNHRMWVANQMSVKRNRAPKYRFVEAQSLDGRTWVNRVAPGWQGQDPSLSFRQRTKTGYHVATPEPAALARFVGFWLAEGCLGRGGGKHYVIVDQKKHVEVAREIVRGTGLNWCETVRKDGVVRFSIQSRELYAYLCPSGTHSVAETKRVPREWVNATEPSITALLDGYRVGDGSYWGREGWWYGSSVCKPLLDDLQEMCFRTGLISNVYRARDANPGTNRLATWYLGVRPTDGAQSGFGLVTLQRDSIKERHYRGTVYCVTTKAGVIATRRNGRVMWGGNSAKALGYGLLHHLGPVESMRKPSTLNRLRKNKATKTVYAPARR